MRNGASIVGCFLRDLEDTTFAMAGWPTSRGSSTGSILLPLVRVPAALTAAN